MSTTHPTTLKRFVFREFFTAALFPLLAIELALVLLYFKVHSYNQQKSIQTLEQESIGHLQEIADDQARILSEQLVTISTLARIMQKDTEHFFAHPDLAPPPSKATATFAYSSQGVYYQTNDIGGCSLYYSGFVPVGPKERNKAARSAVLDHTYQHIMAANNNIVAVYLNTYDSMNRYCPFIEDVARQYLPKLDVRTFNFYYLATEKHNPSRKPVWTEAYLDPAGQGWMMTCAAPVYHDNTLEGVVGIDITISKMLDNVLHLELPWNAEVMLVDARGKIMAMQPATERLLGLSELRRHVYQSRVAADTFKPEEFNLLKTRDPEAAKAFHRLLTETAAITELTIEQEPYLLAQSTEPITGWKLVVLGSKSRILQPIAALEKTTSRAGYLAIAGMVVFYIAFFCYLLAKARKIARRISTPISDIARKSGEIAKGHYLISDSRSQILELDQLTDSYASMVTEIQTLHTGLTIQIECANQEIEERRQAQKSLRESEEKLRAIFDHSCQLIGLLTPEGVVIGINKTALNYAQDREQDVLNRPFWEIDWWQDSTDRDRLRAAITSAANGQPVHFETSGLSGEGKVDYLEFSLNPVKNEQGEVILLVPEGRIVTSEKQTQQDLLHARNSAEAASKSKSQFLANMSHEIRTPMNAIIGMTHLALETRDEDRRRRFLTTVQQSAEGLLGLLNDILDFSKMEAGQLQLVPVRFSLRRLLDSVHSTMNMAAREKRIELRTELAPDLHDRLLGDDLRLRQILINLIGNAIKFTPAGMVTIRAESAEHPADPGKIQLHCAVIDTGIGIPKEKQGQIFDSFEQADSSYVRQYGGTGLGLAICRQLVELMDGAIWVESEQDKGAAFHFIVQLRACEEALPEAEGSSPDAEAVVLSGLRILVTDDNEVNRDVARMTLERHHTVVTAEHGLDALEKIAAEPFDAVFMDIQMPVMDGLTATRIIRKVEAGNRPEYPLREELVQALVRRLAHGRLPIVAMTAHAMGSDQDMCKDAGMNAYVTKPILPGQLEEVLSDLHMGGGRGETEAEQPSSAQPDDAPTLETVRAHLQQITMLKSEQIDQILTAARTSLETHTRAALDAARGNDLPALARATHTLKGTLLQCGLTSWGQQMQAIHDGIQHQADLPYLALLEPLAEAIDELLRDFPQGSALRS
ncbi:MAG: ATP-binding protein [Desulfobulbus sp.]|jgi:PAS domain S-box-containing protein